MHNRIRELRQSRRMTQEEVAMLSGMSFQRVAAAERVERLDLVKAVPLTAALGVHPAALLKGGRDD